jgi:[ribosomal protein S18]-alanine N-acetyltransferase
MREDSRGLLAAARRPRRLRWRSTGSIRLASLLGSHGRRPSSKYFLKYPGNLSIVAEGEAQRIVGFAIAGRQRRQGALLGRLITIDVEAALRRRGVGHRLLEEIESQLRGAGATAVLLEVAVDNTAAQEFYVRHGFARTGRIPGYYLGRIDALAMEKPLG